MRWMLVLVAALAVACSGLEEDRPGCGKSADCAAGQYCARTPDGNVCWADDVAPIVSSVTVTCGDPCLRDGTLEVVASVEDDHEVGEVRVSLDLDPSRSVPMTRTGDAYAATLALEDWPFAHFEHAVRATVTATDGARNASEPSFSDSVPVKRLRWEKAVDAGVVALTAPAVMEDGTVVVGGSNGKLYFVSPEGTSVRDPLPVGLGQITAAPSVGNQAVWVGSEDASLYGVKLDGSALLPGAAVNLDGAIKGCVAVSPSATEEWAFAAAQSGRLGAVSTASHADKTGIVASFSSGPVRDTGQNIYAATGVATATLRSFTFDGAYTDRWSGSSPLVGVNVSAPVAIDREGSVWTGSQDARLVRTQPNGSATVIAVLSDSISDSPVVLANGDVVVGDQSGKLYRLSGAGSAEWERPASLTGAVLAPLTMAETPQVFLVPTKAGNLYALTATGAEVWRGMLGSSAQLRTGNLFTPPGQAGQVLSTAFFSSSDGKLYAVIVDGQLDTSAPWPKAFHDQRNTNNAGTQP
jgi:hypothetical protein